MNSTKQNYSQNWLSPRSLITWQASEKHGTVSALCETALELSGPHSSVLSGEGELQVSWEQSFFALKGSFSESIFLVQSEDLSKLHDLLNSLRKSHHLSICQEQDVEASDRYTGFSEFSFIPEALPDLNWEDISLASSFLGKTFQAPLLITGMTGGIERGQELNKRLAKAAENLCIPMGIGSQRMALENSAYRKIFTVKDYAPNVFLIGNLGGSQLLENNAVDLCKEAVEMVGADALAIHLNVLQECIQAEGSPQFRGLFANLEKICSTLKVPILVKEVGSGISPSTAKRIFDTGVSALDCGGRGGTSWGYIEGLRSSSEQTQTLGQSFRNWGIPTAFSLSAIRKELPQCELIATGGIRDGHTVAKALALGANMVGVGLPLIRAANESEDKVHAVLSQFLRGLQTAMLATGCAKVEDLKHKIVRGYPFQNEYR